MHWIRWLREKIWLWKKARLERKNYIEEQLGRRMPGLFSFAKDLGICFIINPASIRFSGGRKWGWSCYPPLGVIRVPIDPRTKEILPKDHIKQNRAMAHEIGHIKAKEACPRFCPVISDYIYHERSFNCLFEELGAEIEAQGVLDVVYSDDVEFTSLRKKTYAQWEKIIKRQSDLCLTVIKRGDCPKTEEIGALCETLSIELEGGGKNA